MRTEHIRGRRAISKGMESVVLEPILANFGTVLKVPRLFNYISMLGSDQGAVLRQELQTSQALVEETGVKIPKTRIHSTNERRLLFIKTRGYVVRQRFIEEDGSVEDIQAYLAIQGLDTLVDEYKHEPGNFMSKQGVVYWIDPTKGAVGRILEKMGIMKLENYRNLRQKLSKVIRLFAL